MTGSDDRTSRLWDIRNGSSARLMVGATTPICSLSISPLGM